jgi:hypothetical protein
MLSSAVTRECPAEKGRLSFASHRWIGVLAISALAFMIGTAGADAATRFAAPGGSGQAPCLRSDPCSLFLAAANEAPSSERAQKGDEVIVLPGKYSGEAGDLGPDEQVQLPTGVNIYGEPGQTKPVISANRAGWVLVLNGDSIASDLELIAPESWDPLLVLQSTAQRLVVKTWREEGIACNLGFRSVLRDSVCISHGRKGAGAGQHVHTNSFPMHNRTLRNVTAIGTGPESSGIRFDISGGEIFVNVKSSIAQGTATDVEAIGEEPGGGSTITLEASSYSTAKAVEEDGGIASVTEPGTNGNITAAPLLAFDGFHQLSGSPTIDKGGVDSSSGPSDIDGSARVIAAGTDIGADEMQLPTTTAATCSPTTLTFGLESSCTATVQAQDWGPPLGTIKLSALGGLGFGECDLAQSGPHQSTCEMAFRVMVITPNLQLIAAYAGDASHAPSQGSTQLAILPTPVMIAQSGSPPDTFLTRKPARRSRRRAATFAFTSTQADSRFECKLDNKRYQSCQSPFKVKIPKGQHVFKVRAVGATGADPTPAAFHWAVGTDQVQRRLVFPRFRRHLTAE